MKTQTETPPLGIIDCLSAGFGAVAQKPSLLLIPLLLDMFLWLGLRLSLAPLVPELEMRLGAITRGMDDNSVQQFNQNMAGILDSYNLFSALSTWPLGVPSLLAGHDPGTAPLKTPLTIQVHSLSEFLAWLLVLTLTGLLFGSLYLGLIAQRTKGKRIVLSAWTRLLWLYWARIVGFVLLVLVGIFISSVPFFLAVELIAVILGPLLANLVLFAGVGMGTWGLFHLFFAVHGMLLDDMGILQAIGNSIALVHRHRFSAVGLLLIAVVIGMGLSTIWNFPSSESWLRLIAIAGNAFVNTGVAVATFVYYHERTAHTKDTPTD